MTFAHANALFAFMTMDQQEQAVHIFDITKCAFADVREAFANAVSNEMDLIEIETNMRAVQPYAEMSLRAAKPYGGVQ